MVLTNFMQAMEKQKETNYHQYWRYNKKRIPKLIIWLAENPDLAEALAMDARELSNSRGGIVAHEHVAA